MLNFGSFFIFSENSEKLADFYQKVFAKDPDWNMEGYFGFMVGKTAVTIGQHDKVKGKNPNPERIMFNLETEEVEEEFKRIKSLGADIIAEPYHPGEDPKTTIATFADIDGNFFQLMTPWKEE